MLLLLLLPKLERARRRFARARRRSRTTSAPPPPPSPLPGRNKPRLISDAVMRCTVLCRDSLYGAMLSCHVAAWIHTSQTTSDVRRPCYRSPKLSKVYKCTSQQPPPQGPPGTLREWWMGGMNMWGVPNNCLETQTSSISGNPRGEAPRTAAARGGRPAAPAPRAGQGCSRIRPPGRSPCGATTRYIILYNAVSYVVSYYTTLYSMIIYVCLHARPLSAHAEI